MAGAENIVIAPINTLTPDAKRQLQNFDNWLKAQTGGYLSLSTLAAVAQAVPVLNNALAAVDVLSSIRTMMEKKQTDVFDWLDLGINVIGLIPGAGGPLRITLRPALQGMRTGLKNGLPLATEAVLIKYINDHHKGDVEEWAKKFQSTLETDILPKVRKHVIVILLSVMEAIKKLADGQPFDVSKLQEQLEAAKRNRNLVTTEGRGLFVVALALETEIVKRQAGNAAVNAVLSQEVKTKLYWFVANLGEFFKKADTEIKNLAARLKHLITALVKILSKSKKLKRSGSTGGRVENKVQGNNISSLNGKQNQPKEKSDPCKSCGTGASSRSIDFATGQETFSHTDFTLPGIMPISWSRTYCSGLITYERGEMGARWITPYTARIGIRKNELLYHTTDGRAVSFPLLQTGGAYHHPIEDFTLARQDEDWLTLNVGKELLEIYERYGNCFRLSAIKDRNGNALGFHYQGNRLIGVNDSNGHTIGLNYNEQGKVSRIDLLGEQPRRLAAYEYDHLGNLIKATDEAGDVYEYRYQDHLITRYSDRTGRGINLEWAGRRHRAKCIREYNDDGSEELKLEWDKDIRETTVTDAYGNATIYYYDFEAHTYRIIYPDHSEEWFFRDERKNITGHIHPDGSQDQYDYDEHDNLLEHTRPDGSTVSFEYDADNNLTAVTDPQGQRWLREYDSQGNMVRETDPEFNETRYRYDSRGLPVSITDAKGGVKTLSWTADGQISSHTDCSGYTTQWAYDERGRLLSQTDAEGNQTRYQYDPRGQLHSLRQADGSEERYHYDAEGRLLEHSDPLQQTTRYRYDRGGRVMERTDAAGNRVQYRYDLNSRLSGLIDANGAPYRFRYNSVGALTEEIGFDGKTTRYHYQPGSGVLQSIDEAGTVSVLEYDAAGRIEIRSIRHTDANGTTRDSDTESYVYDQSGRLVEARNRHSHYQYFYDALGNLVKEYQHYSLDDSRRSYVWRHRYDELGNRIETLRPDGQRVGLLRYGSGHLHGITLNQREIAAYERDRLHRETERSLGKHSVQQTRYDPLGRILQQTRNGAQRDYRYDPAGQLIQIQIGNGQHEYRYDPVGRLMAAVTSHSRETFAFDPAGNRLAQSTAETEANGTVPTAPNAVWGNLLKEYAGTHYQYDERGNLIEKSENGQTSRYHWNGYNQLIRIDNPNGVTEYRYDPLGRRISKSRNGQTTVYLWQEDTLAVETTAEHSTHYLFEPDSFEPLAQFQTAAVNGIPSPSRIMLPYSYDPEKDPLLQEPAPPQSQPELVYYHLDHLGTPIAASDENGKTVWQASYKAWGEIAEEKVSDGLNINIPFRFQGQYYDEESGLHYNRFRYYDPQLGRFVSQDPIGLEGGINIYAYAPNSVIFADPLGLDYKTWQIHSPGFDDVVQKGLHFYAPGNIELSVRPNHMGGISFTNAIPNQASDLRLPSAIAAANDRFCKNAAFRKDILDKATEGITAVLAHSQKFQGSLKDKANGRSRELREIQRNVMKFKPTACDTSQSSGNKKNRRKR